MSGKVVRQQEPSQRLAPDTSYPGPGMEWTRCNLCGSDRYETHLVRGDLNLFLEGSFSLVRCSACGHVYLNPRPTPDHMQTFYTDEYDQYCAAVQDASSRVARLDRAYGLRKRCKAVLKYRRQGRLLDVGCATGNFLSVMRDYPGWSVAGIEVSEAASDYGRRRFGLDIRTGTVETVDAGWEPFDVVTLWDVIEHLHDPLASLRCIRDWLQPGGLLLITTPNLDSFDARLFGRDWIGYELPRHLHVFSARTLGLLLEKAGYRVLARQCSFGSHAAFASSVRFWLRDNWPHARWRGWAEQALFSRAARLVVRPYFWAMDGRGLSGPLTVFAAKAG